MAALMANLLPQSNAGLALASQGVMWEKAYPRCQPSWQLRFVKGTLSRWGNFCLSFEPYRGRMTPKPRMRPSRDKPGQCRIFIRGSSASACTSVYWLPYIQTASRNLWHTSQPLCGPAKTMLGWHGSALTWLSEGKQPLPVSHQPHNLYPLFCGVCEDSDMLGTLLHFHPYLKGVCSAGGPGSRGKGPSEGH